MRLSINLEIFIDFKIKQEYLGLKRCGFSNQTSELENQRSGFINIMFAFIKLLKT